MKFKKKRPDIFEISRPKLKEIIDMNHKLVKLSKLIDWKRLERRNIFKILSSEFWTA